MNRLRGVSAMGCWEGPGAWRQEARATQASAEYSARALGVAAPEWGIELAPAPLRSRLELRATAAWSAVGFRGFTWPSRTPRFVTELRRLSEVLEGEWPEIYEIAARLRRGERLTPAEERWVSELSEATGWSRGDVEEDLRHVDDDPSERAGRYRELFERYFGEALELKEAGDTQQAAEKIWGAVTALIKLYAALKGVPVIHWSRGKMDSFITSNVEPEHRRLFRDVLDKGQRMHEHFYEADLDPETFEERWRELTRLLERAREIVISHL